VGLDGDRDVGTLWTGRYWTLQGRKDKGYWAKLEL